MRLSMAEMQYTLKRLFFFFNPNRQISLLLAFRKTLGKQLSKTNSAAYKTQMHYERQKRVKAF